VTIVEYTDFNGQFTAMGNATIQKVLEAYPKDVRVLFRHKPELTDDVGLQAAEAALCADDQGRYWDYRQASFRDQRQLDRDSLIRRAGELGLESRRFEACLDSHDHRKAVEADVAEARRYGLAGSPAFSINGTPLSGAHQFRMFRRLIEVELAPRAL
jgi:protein-disulfide isomerase